MQRAHKGTCTVPTVLWQSAGMSHSFPGNAKSPHGDMRAEDCSTPAVARTGHSLSYTLVCRQTGHAETPRTVVSLAQHHMLLGLCVWQCTRCCLSARKCTNYIQTTHVCLARPCRLAALFTATTAPSCVSSTLLLITISPYSFLVLYAARSWQGAPAIGICTLTHSRQTKQPRCVQGAHGTLAYSVYLKHAYACYTHSHATESPRTGV